MRTRLTLAVGAVIGLLVCPRPAAGQSNSLFGARHRARSAARQVPVSQSASDQTAPTPWPVLVGARAMSQSERTAPQTNATLLYVSPFAVAAPEPETLGVNDLITIIVRISKTANSDAKLESKKDWTHEWDLGNWIRLSDKHGLVPASLPGGKPAVAFDYKNDWGGDGKYDRKDSLTTRIQATVIDVKPNGNLVLEAKNDVSFGEEDYTIALTGTCRSLDVTPQNTILSTQIANLDVDVIDRGALRDATRRGWLMRGLDLLRPF